MGVAPGSGYFFLSILFAVIWSVSMCVFDAQKRPLPNTSRYATQNLAIIASFYRRKNTFPPSRLYLSVTDWLAGWLTGWMDGLTTWHQSSLCLALYLLLSAFEQIKHKRSPKHRVQRHNQLLFAEPVSYSKCLEKFFTRLQKKRERKIVCKFVSERSDAIMCTLYALCVCVFVCAILHRITQLQIAHSRCVSAVCVSGKQSQWNKQKQCSNVWTFL